MFTLPLNAEPQEADRKADYQIYSILFNRTWNRNTSWLIIFNLLRL